MEKIDWTVLLDLTDDKMCKTEIAHLFDVSVDSVEPEFNRVFKEVELVVALNRWAGIGLVKVASIVTLAKHNGNLRGDLGPYRFLCASIAGVVESWAATMLIGKEVDTDSQKAVTGLLLGILRTFRRKYGNGVVEDMVTKFLVESSGIMD